MRILCPALLICLVTAATGRAQQWAEDMFDHTTHDFGTVARGTKVEHRFTLENLYVEDVHISAVHSSCNCTIPTIVAPTLKTYEKGEIIAEVDTRKFLGRKDATLRVVFDKPFHAEVQLHTYCYIRSDVVIEPGAAQFGSVQRGSGHTKELTVTYAGRSDWEIVDVESPQPYIKASVSEVSRSISEVSYDLRVHLTEDAPVGYVRDHLTLLTNDNNASARRVPVVVDAVVVSAVSARPSPLPLGVLKAGQTVTRNLVVQAKTPFKILKITGPDERFRFAVSEDPKPLQLVPVTFTAGDSEGKVAGSIHIETDLAGNQTVDVPVDGRVLSTASDAPSAASSPTDRAAKAAAETAHGWKAVTK